MEYGVLMWMVIPCVAIAFSVIASVSAFFDWRKTTLSFAVMVPLLLSALIVWQWILTQKPPLATMSDTRLWYSFFASLAGLFTYLRWRYKWILSYSTVLTSVFLLLRMLKPELSVDPLVPALQSPWFIPHVTVYMFSYSLLGCAFLIGTVGLFRKSESLLDSADTLVYIGLAFLTFGMLSGAIWAKSAWGHFWSWDAKETWALITWLVYLLYIHMRIYHKGSTRLLCILLIFAFACLQMCWWGINYLPSAADSIHVY